MRSKTKTFPCVKCFSPWSPEETVLVLTSMREKARWVRLSWQDEQGSDWFRGVTGGLLESGSVLLSSARYRQPCSCLEADKKASSEALSFLLRETAVASRVILISGPKQIFVWNLVIPLVKKKKRELTEGIQCRLESIWLWHIHLLYFVSFFYVQVKILVDFPRKFNKPKVQALHSTRHSI